MCTNILPCSLLGFKSEVQVFDREGELLRAIGQDLGSLSNAIRLDSADRVYVTTKRKTRVVMDKMGVALAEVQLPCAVQDVLLTRAGKIVVSLGFRCAMLATLS